MAKYSFTIESEDLEQDLATVADILVNAYERCKKIDENSSIYSARKEIKGLDNRIDGIEALMKQNFKEVNNEPSIYHSSKEYEEDKKKK